MIILRFFDLLKFLEKEYGIKVTQKRFSEISCIPPYRLSRLKPKKPVSKPRNKGQKSLIGMKKVVKPNQPKKTTKTDHHNITMKFLNQILEGVWKVILESRKNIRKVDIEENLFNKLVTLFIDYIPDKNEDSPFYPIYKGKYEMENKSNKYDKVSTTNLDYYVELNCKKNLDSRDKKEHFKEQLLIYYNKKNSLK